MERYNCIKVLRESIWRGITVSQWIEMAVRIDITVLQSIEIAFKTDITVLQSIEKAVRWDILYHRVNRDTSSEMKLCHSQ